MKTVALACALALAPLRGADVPLPDFNSGVIGHPPLSLSESLKNRSGPMSFGGFARRGLLDKEHPTAAQIMRTQPRLTPKAVPGQMPILEPNPNIDYKIVLKEPDPTIDFKMIIRPGEPQKPAQK